MTVMLETGLMLVCFLVRCGAGAWRTQIVYLVLTTPGALETRAPLANRRAWNKAIHEGDHVSTTTGLRFSNPGI